MRGQSCLEAVHSVGDRRKWAFLLGGRERSASVREKRVAQAYPLFNSAHTSHGPAAPACSSTALGANRASNRLDLVGRATAHLRCACASYDMLCCHFLGGHLGLQILQTNFQPHANRRLSARKMKKVHSFPWRTARVLVWRCLGRAPATCPAMVIAAARS